MSIVSKTSKLRRPQTLLKIIIQYLFQGAFFTSFIEPFFFKRRIKAIEIVLGLMVVACYENVFGIAHVFLRFEQKY